MFSGKKRTNRKEQIELLSELYRISEEHNLGSGMAIKIHFAICAAIFDYNPKISAAMKPEYWEKCMPAVEFLLKLISENEEITIGDHISEEQEVLEEKPYKVTTASLIDSKSRLEKGGIVLAKDVVKSKSYNQTF